MKRFLWLLPFVLVACSHKADTKKDTRTEAQKAFGQVAGKSEEAKPEVKKTAEAASNKAKDAVSDAKAAAPVAGTITCKSGKDSRTLATAAKGAGCELTYTKHGESKVAGNGAAGSAACEKIASKIKANLEKSGFTCQ
jgi:hypothetical protein